jgi:alkylhydroperoxidase/carboxymuconolactone decarboxylase family protein YurZ
MYIIKTVSKSKKNSSAKYYTYRLMESVRVGKKVKKITLLNLGSTFSVEQKNWVELSTRINEIINQTPNLFELDSKLETLAQEYAKKIIASKAKAKKDDVLLSKEEDKYKEIDITTVKNSNPKSVGVENIVYETIKELKLDTKLQELGFTNIQTISAIGSLVAKITNPSSDIQTYNWLCKTSGINELIDCDFNQISSSNIYRVADKLNTHKDELEMHLYNRQKQIFDYDETITLYDLTNTYFEGTARGIARAKRGRSKEKRSDAPLVTLGIMLDSSGFVRKSEIFDGNIGESTTFKGMLDRLKVKKEKNLFTYKSSLIVMDAGIASEENINYLVENGYEYIVVSRKKDKQFDESKSTPVKLDSKKEVIVKAQKVINEDGEIELFIHSKARESKENAMLKRVQNLFLESLQYLKDGLTLKRRTKNYEKVIERIGRIKEKYSAIAQYYNISVTKDSNSKSAIDIKWSEKKSLDNKSSINGVYCLRSNNTTMDEKTLWKTYTTLTDLEAVFKSLKSELGLRPIFHQKQSRVDAHLFITLLAYSIVHTIRYKLKRKGIHYSWDSIRKILGTTDRITTSMRCKDGTTIHIRRSVELELEQKEIYDALNIKYQIGEVNRVYI